MADFAFRMNAAEKKHVKGALEVKAKRATRMGISDRHVPEGSIGYVTAARPGTGKRMVFWPSLQKEHPADWRSGEHHADDLEPTGRRG